MKRILVMLPVIFTLLASCKLFHKSTGDSPQSGTNTEPRNRGLTSAERRWNINSPEKPPLPDSPIVSGPAEYIKLQGRSENGVAPNLEGTWELQSIDGKDIADHPDFTEEVKEKMAKDDSIKNARTKIPPELLGGERPRLTPPQGGDFHLPEKPYIRFYGSNETFSGFTGCNRFSGRYVMVDDKSISLKSAGQSTRVICMAKEYDEDKFLEALHRVTGFRGENGRLELLEGSKVILVFNKKPGEP